MFRPILQPIVRNTRTGFRSYHVPQEVRPAHMDELPIPAGSWKESYDKNNRRYNLQLIIGIVSLIGTIAVGRANGMLWLNYAPPKPKSTE